ncbi:MAG: hypothetical protein HZB70_01570 [Candidatus Berkelbacteria bacterium]|nr:MAG: hypothetical protein HZB70_01570 [Candidatus Berkelbacteria bacterium]QQG51978.1 MAG: hypothetical protein HY845_01425 [Candidatus Berkelbacteria bacterium]
MTRSIFKTVGSVSLGLVLAFGLLAYPTTVRVLAEDTESSSTTEQTEAQKKEAELKKTTAENLREQVKKEREARKAALETAKNAREDKKLESSKELAEKLTEERLELLKKLRDGEYTKKCRAAAKAEATTAINAVIARLEQDLAAVPSNTTVDQVRSQIKNGIIGKNHVYVALLPAVRGMCASDRIIGLIDGKLKTLVDRLKADGLDTTTLEGLLAQAKTSAQAAYDAYKKIANDPGASSYKTDLAAAKAKLKEAKTSLSAARDEIDKLKELTSSEDESSTPTSR